MTELLIATQNAGKLREIKSLLADFHLKITSLADYPHLPAVEEHGKSFRENAAKKALTIAKATGKLVLGEDSGLEVKALGNRPGIYSARFSASNPTDEKNNAKLLRLLKGLPLAKRQARYRCAAVLAKDGKIIATTQGSCEGRIALEPKGSHGFGYDPLFYIPRYKKTFGELECGIKDAMSHRSRALGKMKDVLKEYLKKK
jgi:XTP/dITP diphosphohydrolase